jgi:hypothetical protein
MHQLQELVRFVEFQKAPGAATSGAFGIFGNAYCFEANCKSFSTTARVLA